MNHPPLPIKEVGDKSKKAQHQCGNDNTRPNENGTNHELNPGIMD
jgi:hypothetical protein